MRLLLDSHAIIWYVDQDHLLSPAAHSAITDPANDLLVSAGTLWEIAIKVGSGKLSLSAPYRTWMTKAVGDLWATVLPITIEYAEAQAGLPSHHRDPFDRLLVAQALIEHVSVVSSRSRQARGRRRHSQPPPESFRRGVLRRLMPAGPAGRFRKRSRRTTLAPRPRPR